MDKTINQLVKIGFCQPRHYQKTVWNYAKRMMDLACLKGYAEPFDFGKGKGKYVSNIEIKEVVSLLSQDRQAQEIARKYGNYIRKLEKQTA
jgi:hypothetical protein